MPNDSPAAPHSEHSGALKQVLLPSSLGSADALRPRPAGRPEPGSGHPPALRVEIPPPGPPPVQRPVHRTAHPGGPDSESCEPAASCQTAGGLAAGHTAVVGSVGSESSAQLRWPSRQRRLPCQLHLHAGLSIQTHRFATDLRPLSEGGRAETEIRGPPFLCCSRLLLWPAPPVPSERTEAHCAPAADRGKFCPCCGGWVAK